MKISEIKVEARKAFKATDKGKFAHTRYGYCDGKNYFYLSFYGEDNDKYFPGIYTGLTKSAKEFFSRWFDGDYESIEEITTEAFLEIWTAANAMTMVKGAKIIKGENEED